MKRSSTSSVIYREIKIKKWDFKFNKTAIMKKWGGEEIALLVGM